MDLPHPTAAPADALASPLSAMGAERRLLTVLVSDLVGSTALAVTRDPEDMRAIIAEFLLCCAEAVERAGTMQAIAGLIERLSRVRPVLMVLEDAQWADPTTLELLERLLGAVGAMRALVLVACRPEFVPAWLARPNVATIALDRLSARDIGLMIDDVAGKGALSAAVRSEIVVRAGGVPLFAEEIARAALEGRARAPRRPCRRACRLR